MPSGSSQVCERTTSQPVNSRRLQTCSPRHRPACMHAVIIRTGRTSGKSQPTEAIVPAKTRQSPVRWSVRSEQVGTQSIMVATEPASVVVPVSTALPQRPLAEPASSGPSTSTFISPIANPSPGGTASRTSARGVGRGGRLERSSAVGGHAVGTRDEARPAVFCLRPIAGMASVTSTHPPGCAS